MTEKISTKVNKLQPGSAKTQLVLYMGDYDWATTQYRAGMTLRMISDKTGISRGKLFDYFSNKGICRDIGQEVRNRTNQLLANDYVDMSQATQTADAEQIISINATLQAALIREHRTDINRMRRLCMAMLQELEHQTHALDWYLDLGEILRKEDDKGVDKLNDLYHKVISTPGRVDSLKKLGETLKILIALERQAFGMREDFEDSEIRKAKQAALTPADMSESTDDYTKITQRFMKVLGQAVEEANVVKETSDAPVAD